ncbi:MAG TPA: diguanylate cyclase [Trichocoleus sp.]
MASDDGLDWHEIDHFAQQLSIAQGQAQQLHQKIKDPSCIPPDLAKELISQLQLALEELQVAHEELLQQNEALVASQQLTQAEAYRYHDLFEFSPEAYLVTDEHGIILEANRAAVELLELSKGSLLGKPIAGFVALEKRSEFRVNLCQVVQGARLKDWEFTLQLKQGDSFPAALTVNALQNQNTINLRWLVRDIRRQKLLERALQRDHEMLEQKVQERTTELVALNQLLVKHTEQERLMGAIAYQIRQSLDLDAILDTTAIEVRKFLQVDRVVIYRFKADWSGVVTVESVAPGRLPILYTVIEDPCFRENYVSLYKGGRVRAIEDIYTSELDECHITMLSNAQVRANLVVPILKGEVLWGLLIAHHCQSPRPWQTLEIELLRQLSTQVGIAIQQSELYQQVQRLAVIDGLTQISNRRNFDEYLEKMWEKLSQQQVPLSLIICDVDYFKSYNDTYGHQAGDDCLRKVASVISGHIQRANDLLARYGGEEFIIALPETNLQQAGRMAEAIRESVEALEIDHCNSKFNHITISLGVSSLVPDEGATSTALVTAADQALYQAKAKGRNQVCLYSEVNDIEER